MEFAKGMEMNLGLVGFSKPRSIGRAGVFASLLLLCGCHVLPEDHTNTQVTSHATELVAPTSDEARTASRNLLLAHNFGEFEKTTELYRSTMAKTSDGFPRLAMQYAAINFLCPNDPNDQCWTTFSKLTKDWLSSHKKSPTAVILAGAFALRYAEVIHSQAPQPDTYQDASQSFKEHVSDAKSIFDTGQEAASVDPAWYKYQIQIANYQGGLWQIRFDLASKGLAIDPNYFEIYFLVLDFLTVSNGKQPEALKGYLNFLDQNFGRRGAGDYYARLAYRVMYAFGADELVADDFQWPLIKQSFEDIIKKYPGSWNLNNYAAMACVVGDKPVLKAMLDRIGPSPDPEAWFHDPQLLSYCQNVVAKDNNGADQAHH